MAILKYEIEGWTKTNTTNMFLERPISKLVLILESSNTWMNIDSQREAICHNDKIIWGEPIINVDINKIKGP